MHNGKIIAEKGGYKVIDCEKCKFAHLYPLPSQKEMIEFYQKKYYKLIKKGGRAPELRRQMADEKETKTERDWLRNTLYNDINQILDSYIESSHKKLFDIGSGTGEFLRYMKTLGWDVTGVEPDRESSNSELNVCKMSLEEYILNYPDQQFDVVTILSVLEHVPDPKQFLMNAKKLIKPINGYICIRVPNDFSEFQIHAEKMIDKSNWWVAIPDHLNYFNTESLKSLLESLDFTIMYSTTDFPMELFLLMGDDYVENPEIGSICHKKRINFELALPDDLRRKIYQKMAEIGIGRDCMVFAKINSGL